MSKIAYRSVSAFSVTVGYLFLMATPAGSNGMNATTFFIHTGAIALDVDGDEEEDYEFEVDGSGESHTCADPEAPHGEVITDTDGTDTIVEEVHFGEDHEDGFFAIWFDFFGTEYALLTQIGDPNIFTPSTGMIDGTHPNQILTQHVVIYGFIYEVDENCVTSELPTCELVIDFTLEGTYNITEDMINLAGEGHPEVAACESPFASIGNGLATVNDLTLRMTPPIA